MRASRLDPTKSAYEQVHGVFDFNCTPLAPPGMKVMVHEKPHKRATWAPHASEGWYTGPAVEHYRFFSVWIPETRSMRVCNTVAWFPSTVPIPNVSPAEIIIEKLDVIQHTLQKETERKPMTEWKPSTTKAIQQLTSILHHAPSTTNTTSPENVPSDKPCVSIDESQNTTMIIPSRPVPPLRVTDDAHPVTIPSQAHTPVTVDTSEHTPSLRVPVEHTETEPPNTTYANSTKPKTAKQRLAQRHFKNHQRKNTTTPTIDGQCNRAIDAHRFLTAI
jgi:hypothetical protein